MRGSPELQGVAMAEKTAQIKIPEGVDASKVASMFEKYLTQRVDAVARDKAYRASVKTLIEKYQKEFDALMEKNKE